MADILITLLKDFWTTAAEMAPYLLFGFFIAGVLSVLFTQETVERHIGKKGILSILKASIFGVPLPLCSCGVIPVGMSLRKHGASRGATIAFLISTPQTGADNIMIILSMLGPVFAILSPAAALITGLYGGLLVTYFGEKRPPKHNGAPPPPPKCSDPCCSPHEHETKTSRFARAMKYAFVTLPADIGRFLLIGLVIAALISALIPPGFFTHKLSSGFLQMLLMMALGIPMYVCSSASVPVAAALIHTGISPGAALVFLMSGPATNAATITTLWNVLGKRTALLYVFSIATGALAAGLLLNLFNSTHPALAVAPRGITEHPYLNNISALILFAILSQSLFRKKHPNGETCALS